MVAAAQAESIGIEPPEAGAVLTMDKNAMRITDSQPLLNMPLMLLKATVELDFDHIKTMQTAYALYAKKLISYPFTVQNTIPFGVWKLMLRNKKIFATTVSGARRPDGSVCRAATTSATESAFTMASVL